MPLPADALRGRTVLITGPTSGLGRAPRPDALAGLGARLVLVGRSQERLAAVRDELVRAARRGPLPAVVADMARSRPFGAAAELHRRTEARLDVVIDNAGAIFPERAESPDGYRGDARDDGRRARSRSSPACCRCFAGPAAPA